MKNKEARCIKAEPNKEKEIKIYIEDNGYKEFETISDLIKILEMEMCHAENNGKLEEFLNRRISLELTDIRGQMITGDVNMCIGCPSDKLILAGNIQSVNFIRKENDYSETK